MKRIYKWKLQLHGDSVIPFSGPKFDPLTVQVQGALDIVVWAEVEPDSSSCGEVVIRGVVTGGEPPENGIYIGTVQIHHGTYVVHYYLLT